MPPELQAQMFRPAAPTFQQMGAGPGAGGIPNPIDLLDAAVARLESWAAETAPLLNSVNPALTTLMIPIATAGKALQEEIASLRQRTSGPSPQVTGSMPPNVPGNIPGGRPAQ